MYYLSCGERGAGLGPRDNIPAEPPRITAWVFVVVGGILVTTGMALETESSAWLAMAALGVIFAGLGYLSQQVVAKIPWSLGRCLTWIASVADRLAIHDRKRGMLLLLAAGLWCLLTLATASAAILWGDKAGLIVVSIGGTAAVLIEVAARRLYG